MNKVVIINGPNLNLLGTREPEIYGSETFDAILNELRHSFSAVEISYFQSNVEGELVTAIQEYALTQQAIIVNLGAYSHYSIALLDALKATALPKVEVHLSNIYQREEFRAKSLTAQACTGVISGFGKQGYAMAMWYLTQLLVK